MAKPAFYSKAQAILRGLLLPGMPDSAALADALFDAIRASGRFEEESFP